MIEWYRGTGRCPGCNEVRYFEDQMTLFRVTDPPHTYRVGVPEQRRVPPEVCSAPDWDEWWRLRPALANAQHVDVVMQLEDVFECACGRWLAPVLRWRAEPPMLCLEAIRLVDVAQPGFEREVDFIREWAWSEEARALDDTAERMRWIRGWLARWTAPKQASDGWTVVVGPTQCEACGHVRERTLTTLFTQPSVSPPESASLLGPRFGGGTIYLGDRVHVGADWQPVPYFYTVLRPVGATLTVLSKLLHFGCACGAGRAAMVQRFARRGEELELVELALRVVRSEADLADVDVVEGAHPRLDLAGIAAGYRID